MSLNESIIKGATLEWFEGLGYAIVYGPHIVPSELRAKDGMTIKCNEWSGLWLTSI